MQSGSDGETEGIVSLRKLQRNDYKIWSKEEVEDSDLPNMVKEILYFIARENNFKRIPQQRDIRRRFHLPGSDKRIYLLKEREMAFSITLVEICRFYGLKYLGYHHGHFQLPPTLEVAQTILGTVERNPWW
jgi:hypothetical protein